ncbi:hypothetical protein QTP81_09045 [Alteromonas sp. ASW11-36]|uniref:Co-chaperone DjlA N-terminal domain-containing protein n=1 Tax=Alteromonas arenosi TaxID=3055817 RepID=A0ABT7SX25_9ALTE|nr:hypothetical protein [Alteromonas sp. ASW11-36]MDM7860742.1 hypothetical protein [Alteromonas sp. ASW11-36]
MEVLILLVGWFAYASVFIGMIKSYLTVNKIWTRKHDRNVAESISVYAALLGLVSALPFFIKYLLIDQDYASALQTGIGLAVGTFFLLVGIGFWTKQKTANVTFWQRFIKAIKKENNEATDLIKALVKPKHAERISKIFTQLVLIDGRIDDKERELLNSFHKIWNLTIDFDELANSSKELSFIELRDSVADYVAYNPPYEQVSEVKGLLETIANIDNNVSDEESFILQEIYGIFDDYLNGDEELPRYEVLIAPQNTDQEDMLEHLLPTFTKVTDKGGVSYRIGEYYSLEFAQMMCKKYRSMNIFTAIEQA